MSTALPGSALPVQRTIALGAALLATSAMLVPTTAQAAPTAAAAFTMDSQQLTSAQVGRTIALRVTPVGQSAVDCTSVKLQARTATGAWRDVPIDWQASGCWTGGTNLVTSITRAMAGHQVRMVGRLRAVESVPQGTVTIAGAGTTTRRVDVPALAQGLPARFHVVASTAPLAAGAVGRSVSIRVTPTAGAQLLCDQVRLQTQSADGRWSDVAINWQASGCWTGGTNLVANATRAMAGRPLRLTAAATRTGSAAPSLTATANLAGASQQLAVSLSATAPSDPAPSTPAPSTPAPTTPAPTTPAPTTPAPTTPAPSAAPSAPGNTDPGRGPGPIPELNLPRVAWEGGAAYYARFPDAVKAGWSNPNHFPIAVWWGGYATDAQVKSDKAHGINTYIVVNPDTDTGMMAANGMSLFTRDGNPAKPRTATRDSVEWVADYLEDEADAWAADPKKVLHDWADKLADHDKPRYANFTAQTYSWREGRPERAALMNDLVNNYADIVSSDAYWYLSGECDAAVVHGDAYLTPFTKANCRTPQAYGRNVASLRKVDATDGKLKPVWNFVEMVPTGQDNGTINYTMSTAEMKAAAMSSIIHEARGLTWFNQSFGKQKCATGNALRSAEQPGYGCKQYIAAAGEVSTFIQSLAPVLNTQSYAWNFGPGTETMLKVHGGSAYLFAMADDDGTKAGPGTKTFTLPPQLRGHRIQVLGENRTITPNPGGTFQDNFAALTSYHVYKIG